MDGGALAGGGRIGRWCRWHPVLACGVAVALYGGVFALRLMVHGATEAILVLSVLPVALVAMAFGARAGWAAGLSAVLLLTVWVAISGESLSPLGWVARATPMVLLGVMLGAAADALRAAATTEQRLVVAQARQREAAEINDSIIQRLAAAKWSLEAGDGKRTADLLAESIETAEALVADLLRGQEDRVVARTQGPR